MGTTMKTENYFVTSGAGFIGSNIALGGGYGSRRRAFEYLDLTPNNMVGQLKFKEKFAIKVDARAGKKLNPGEYRFADVL